MRLGGVAAPGRTVVHQHAPGQTVALKRARQVLLHRLRPLIGTGQQAQG